MRAEVFAALDGVRVDACLGAYLVGCPVVVKLTGRELAVIDGEIAARGAHLERLVNVGKLIEAVELTRITRRAEAYAHLLAFIVVEELQTASPGEGTRVAHDAVILQLWAVSEVIGDEGHSVRDMKFAGGRGEPVEADLERLEEVGDSFFCIDGNTIELVIIRKSQARHEFLLTVS
jgi:hypothetical protein